MTRVHLDDAGVSTVIGAILIAAMVATVFAHVQLHHVPVWEARAEDRHAQDVQMRLAGFHSALVGPEGAGLGAAATLPLRPSTDLLSNGAGGESRVTFRAMAAPAMISLDRFVQPNSTGPSASSTWTENWIASTSTIDDIEDVYNFRLRIDEVGGGQQGYVRVIAQDASGRYAGNFTVRQEVDPPNTNVFIETTDGQNVVHYNNPSALHLSSRISPYWVDVLDPTYRYDGLLRAAPKPLTFQIEQHVLTAAHTISYSTTSASGSLGIVGGMGDPVDVDLAFDRGGVLEHAVDRVHLVPQRLLIEHGAVVLAQPDGAVFQIPPLIDVRNLSGTLHVNLVLPILEGEATGVGGGPVANLNARPLATQDYAGMASRVAINLTTAFPALWSDLLIQRLAAAGTAAADHTLTTGPDWVRVAVDGPSPDPDTPDLSLRMSFPRYQLNIGG